jgi:hypothetical protein
MRKAKQISDPTVLDWYLMHPTKVGIAEAIRWIGKPMSAADLQQVFAGGIDLMALSYHVKTLNVTNASTSIHRPRNGYGQT